MTDRPVRVRFAPSPTGFLHLGGARTALYNYLYAKRHGGTFVLRIEDTDAERSTEEAERAIIDSLDWLGLHPDEGPGLGGEVGPYRQSERHELYLGYVERLRGAGVVYECFCSSEELQTQRDEATKKKLPPRYDGRCLRLIDEEKEARRAAGISPVLRIRAPREGRTVFDDLIRGHMEIENSTLDDYIILRSDGSVTFNLAVVVDDDAMGITHIIRGNDHLSNTPRQLIIYDALGLERPQYAHMSLLLGTDGARLSKRHGATRVEQYRDEGFLHEAMVNYLAFIGWSVDDSTDRMRMEELIEKFVVERLSRNPSIFDRDKLLWLNGTYIREMSAGELTDRLTPFWAAAGLATAEDVAGKRAWFEEVTAICQERMKVLSDIGPLTSFFFTDELHFSEKDAAELEKEESRAALAKAIEVLTALGDFSRASIEETLRKAVEDTGSKPRKFFQPLRIAVTGTRVSPPLFESMELLGRERTMQRIEAAAGR